MTTVQPDPTRVDDPEPATMPLRRPALPGRPPVERRPDVPISDDALTALCLAVTGVC